MVDEAELPATTKAQSIHEQFISAVKQFSKEQNTPVNVSTAIRKDVGKSLVRGMVVSISEPYKMIAKTRWQCAKCVWTVENEIHDPPLKNTPAKSKKYSCPQCDSSDLIAQYDYANAISIQLQDEQPKAELERLDAILTDKDTLDISAGEIVTVKGKLQIESNRSKRLHNVLYAESIQYENRESVTLTDKDIAAIKRFAALQNVIDRLTAMTAPNVIGHSDKKLGILRSAVGAPEKSIRGRIHTLFVGTPGTAKSTLAREAAKLVPNSRYVTAQNASGKSLTAIIDKEDEHTTLRLGAIPQAKGAICVINEIGGMNFEDQRFLLDIAEEGTFTIDKYGIHKTIRSPTTIIATANPFGSDWHGSTADKSEIPLRKELLDRIDQPYVFKDFANDDAAREYADQKLSYDRKKIEHNYNFLKKYLQHAKTIEPELSDKAEELLKEYWIELKRAGIGTTRTLDTLVRLVKAQARLHLKHVADEDIAREVMDTYTAMMVEYGKVVEPVKADPRESAYEAIVQVILTIEHPITFTEAAKLACHRDDKIKDYLGSKFSVSGNKRLRSIKDIFQERADNRIHITSLTPLTLRRSNGSNRSQSEADTTASGDPNDLSDLLAAEPKNMKYFDDIYKQLEKERNDGIVQHDELKTQLVASGKFTAGEAHHAIEYMLRTKRLQALDYHEYRRTGYEAI